MRAALGPSQKRRKH